MPFSFSFPCLRPFATNNVVPLPGVSYQFNISRPEGDAVLQALGNTETVLDDEIHDSRKKDQKNDFDVLDSFSKFETEFSVAERGKNTYTCLVPTSSTGNSFGCITVLQSFAVREDAVSFTFKGLRRAKIMNPELNLHDQVWISTVVVQKDVDLANILKEGDLEECIKNARQSFKSLTSSLKHFTSYYKNAMQDRDGEFGHLLLLSPLSNMMYLQLSRGSFIKSWDSLNRSLEFLPPKITEKKDLELLLQILDMSVAILPLAHLEKLRFLALEKPQERLQALVDAELKLTRLFAEIYDSVKRSKVQLRELTAQEKANFVALHLNALRKFLGITRKSRSRLPESKIGGLLKGSSNSAVESQDVEEDDATAMESFLQRIEGNDLHQDGRKMLLKDLRRFRQMQPQNSEYQVLKNYFDVIVDIPFKTRGDKSDPVDLRKSKDKLDTDHFGLHDVKRRLVEYLSVMKLNETVADASLQARPPILLLSGPPGVGKTSIAKSIADVLGRKFHRISLGGIYNEAEIRGHRRTYVGAMCGLIINALRKSGSMKPLILLDEIDKVLSLTGAGKGGRGASINGDPGAALLEVLDPEQNSTFTDHYVGFPVDLSNVLFFCTANDSTEISAPLLNRMEVIEIPGYSLEEKIEIGAKFLLPKQVRLNGLQGVGATVELSNDAWNKLVAEYTREPGVRGLERSLASLVRGKVVEYVNGAGKDQHKLVNSADLVKYLGFPPHPISKELVKDVRLAEKSGVVNGLAYSSSGSGGVLVFEVVRIGTLGEIRNGPKVHTTGNLGSLLNESIEVATALVKSLRERSVVQGLIQDPFEEFRRSELHLHVPMGAVSKDGPSAGLAITLALLSIAFDMPVPTNLCMTGEITSRGKVLPIGGVKEKLLGARLFGMNKVMVPLSNRTDVIESVMDSEGFEKCLKSTHFPELSVVRQKWHLELHYVDDLFDSIRVCWPHSFQVKGNKILMIPTVGSARPLL
ncbi:LAFA_0G21242g1_1 [Lachancea sp. 'fantastica']|nr:LAFA_0G21242g1_1 [Lachancea sp. 'fantastica']